MVVVADGVELVNLEPVAVVIVVVALFLQAVSDP